MAIYTCEECGRLKDDDYEPMLPYGEIDVCDSCFEELLDQEREANQKLQDHKDSMEAAAEDFNDDKRRGL